MTVSALFYVACAFTRPDLMVVACIVVRSCVLIVCARRTKAA